MATIYVFELLAALPEDARPQAMSAVLKQNPTFYNELRSPNDPHILSMYGKNSAALAVERGSGKNPAPWHEIVTTPAQNGRRATKRIYYRLGDIYRWMNGEMQGGLQSIKTQGGAK